MNRSPGRGEEFQKQPMYLSLNQIAESFGVPEKSVEDWMRNEGLPHISDRGRLFFDRVQVANWAETRGLAARAGFLAPEMPSSSGGWLLEPLLRSGGIWRDIPANGVIEVFRRVVTSLPGTTPAIQKLLEQRLAGKNGVAYAPIGGGFALPHLGTRISLGRNSGAVALILLNSPLKVDDPMPDAVPITRLFFFVAPSPRAHLDLVGRLCRLLKDGPARDLVILGAPDLEIFRAVAAGDGQIAGGTEELPTP